MKTVNVEYGNTLKKSYPILISNKLDESFFELLINKDIKKAVLVTNETIFSLYSAYIENFLNEAHIQVEYCIIPDGEQYKQKDFLEKIITCAFELKLSRNDAFIAFGGGVVGDMTGFAAAIYLRGIKFIQIPTTILAQVDSSVGGKVAVNTPYGKNLLGAFYQPIGVFSDLELLKTLPKREILSGLSEVLKYSFIEKSCGTIYGDFSRFLAENSNSILNLSYDAIEKIVMTSCEIKANIVSIDEKENGLRAILNFGHTIGHAIEKCTKYTVFTHGEAVSIGMRAVFLISLKLNKISEDYFEFANRLLDLYGLTFKIPENILISDIISALNYDKKVLNNKIRFVLPVEYAKVGIFDNIDNVLIEEVLKELY